MSRKKIILWCNKEDLLSYPNLPDLIHRDIRMVNGGSFTNGWREWDYLVKREEKQKKVTLIYNLVTLGNSEFRREKL
jgi:hypothetical protein